MAHTVTSAPASGTFRRVIAAIYDELASAVNKSDAMRQYRALSALSDADLADRGLTRQSLARYVFADRTWA